MTANDPIRGARHHRPWGLACWPFSDFVPSWHLVNTYYGNPEIGKRETATKIVINLKFSIFLGLRYLLFSPLRWLIFLVRSSQNISKSGTQKSQEKGKIRAKPLVCIWIWGPRPTSTQAALILHVTHHPSSSLDLGWLWQNSAGITKVKR